MKQITTIDQSLVQRLSVQQVQLLTTEIAFISSFDFTVDELLQAGWSIELIDSLIPVLALMKEQIKAAGLDAD